MGEPGVQSVSSMFANEKRMSLDLYVQGYHKKRLQQ